GDDSGFGVRRKAVCEQRHRPQGLPPARATASNDSACRGGARGGAGRRGSRPLAEWLPWARAVAACAGVAATTAAQ
ncbi:hypothetical protein B296_00051136, partial [Ensete ventricosum]